MAQPRPVGHISSDRLLSRQAETYEAKIQAMGELLESEKRLALETQASKYQIKVAELEDVISEMGQANAELGAEKERLLRALPSTELLSSDLRNKPITERANELTDDIDRCTEPSLVRIMRAIDGQIFYGYRQYPALNDPEVQSAMEAVAALVSEHLSVAPSATCVVVGGAGTSGRLAYFVTREFNTLMKSHGRLPCFRHCIAGGDTALFKSVEGAEDDPAGAVDDLKRASLSPGGTTFGRIVYIGVSCGFSATYVGAQLEYAASHPQYAAVALGFNPIPLAKSSVVSGWGSSMQKVLIDMQTKAAAATPAMRRHFVINPVLGPEAIQGSSRLKGGTATKMILEVIFALAASQALKLSVLGGPPVPERPRGAIREDMEVKETTPLPFLGGLLDGIITDRINRAYDPSAQVVNRKFTEFSGLCTEMLLAYEATVQAVYKSPIHELLVLAQETLRAGRSVWYVGSDGMAMVGMIDASEQVPTFGARDKDVRGFISGGWEAMGLYSALGQLTAASGLPAVSTDYFIEQVLPSSNTSDLVILVHSVNGPPPLPSTDHIQSVIAAKKRRGFQMASVEVRPSTYLDPDGASARLHEQKDTDHQRLLKHTDLRLLINLPDQASTELVPGLDVFSELALKLVLNVVSTGAFVRLGKVYRSRMIDVRVSNLKLYRRACHLVAEITGVSMDVATEVIIRTIHDVDVPKPLPKMLWELSVTEHLERAKVVNRLVPTAILIATGKYTLLDARKELKEGVPVRDLVIAALPNQPR